jgi:hypothetical protein
LAHWRSFTDRETLGAWDLVDTDGKPCDKTLEISRVVGGKVVSQEKPKGERRPFVYLRGPSGEWKKPLVCNSTNAKTIAAMAGSDDVTKWVGLRITLYATTTTIGRKGGGSEEVACIRVRPRRATGPLEQLEDRGVDEEMRAKQEAALDRTAEQEG